MMYTLLIVDDEDMTIELLVSSIEWECLDIVRVLTANSVMQAQELLWEETVDIILCDIEMPGQDGLELLAWLKEEGLPAICIVLSGHANFEYARQAMDLDSMAYILKPVSFDQIEKIVLQAEQKLSDTRRMERFAHYGEQWLHNSDKVLQAFWREVLLGEIADHPGALQVAINKRDLSIDLHGSYSIQHFFGMQNSKVQEGWYRDASISNLFAEVFPEVACLPLVMNHHICCISNTSVEETTRKCERILEQLNTGGCGNIAAFISKPTSIDTLHVRYVEMLEIIRGHLAYQGIYQQAVTATVDADYTRPDVPCWSRLLTSGDTDNLRREIRAYFHALIESGSLSGHMLDYFYHDFMQMVYAVISEKGLPANAVFPADSKTEARPDALAGLLDVYRWSDYVVEQTVLHVTAQQDSRSIEEQVKSFVRQNILKGVTRADISAHLHLSPEYLSRLFKHSSGVSLSNFIQEERLITAKSLLSNTQMPVSEIAGLLGYSNFAYFSQLFKKMTGLQPVAFRNEEQES